ncbi:UDP-N-acetylmuramate dehydrogenase [Oscillospiraceae bacterium MB08-C2-2]|nr:UDP-N-acetylmuramate dehydrogenase [Oscillospiraceae bacterium MB08-C2-2]
MNLTQLLEFCRTEGVTFAEQEPLKKHTTFQIGGNADLMVWPEDEEGLAALLALAEESAVPVMVIGKGSNLLCSDEGFRGMVVCLSQNFSGVQLLEDGVSLYAKAGTPLSQLCFFALEHSLEGLEFAYGIPGTVGGAVFMNAGAYGGEMKDVLSRASHLDPQHKPGTFNREQLDLSYRHSAYSDGGYIITGAAVTLQKGDAQAIHARMEDFMSRRREKQPLECPSAGSTFKRPVGGYASALIDQCGLKGCSVGGALVSPKHAGFVVSDGTATAADVLALVAKIQQEVAEKTGFHLECEIRRVGQGLCEK